MLFDVWYSTFLLIALLPVPPFPIHSQNTLGKQKMKESSQNIAFASHQIACLWVLYSKKKQGKVLYSMTERMTQTFGIFIKYSLLDSIVPYSALNAFKWFRK